MYYQKNELTTGRTRHCTAYYQGFVYVFGGISSHGPTNSCEIFDMNNNSWLPLPPMSEVRYNASVCKVGNDNFYVFGGRGADNRPLVSIEVLDASNGVWTTLDVGLPEELCHSAVQVADDKIQILGGFGENRPNVVHQLDLTTM